MSVKNICVLLWFQFRPQPTAQLHVWSSHFLFDYGEGKRF
jgi:hypothetical protein